MSRITAADVQVADTLPPHVMALVTGRNRTYVVDHNPGWSSDWLCTCGNGPTCAHVRATKEAVNG